MPYTVSVGTPMTAPASSAARSARVSASSRSRRRQRRRPGEASPRPCGPCGTGPCARPRERTRPPRPDSATAACLVLSHLQQERASRPEGAGRLRHETPVHVETIQAAVESGDRLEQPDVGGERRDVAGADVGRVADHYRRVDSPIPASRSPCRNSTPAVQTERPRVLSPPPPALPGYRRWPAPAPRLPAPD